MRGLAEGLQGSCQRRVAARAEHTPHVSAIIGWIWGGLKRERNLSGNKVTCLKISFWHQLLTRRILEGVGERERVHQPLAERGRGRRAGGSTQGAERRCLARALIPR